MRGGFLNRVEYTRRASNAARSHRSARGISPAQPAGSRGWLGGRGALVGPAQAARRLPRHRAPGPRHGSVRRVHHARHVAAERAARPGASAPRLVAADPPFARDADAPHGHGAAGARREGARVDPAREQPLQRGARAPRVGGGGFREARDPEDPRRAGRGDDAGRRHRESRARREDRLGDAAAQHPRGSALPLDRRPGRRAGAEGECAHGRPARQLARHQPALARHHRQRRPGRDAARARGRLRHLVVVDPAVARGAWLPRRALRRSLRRLGHGAQPRRVRRARRAAQRHLRASSPGSTRSSGAPRASSARSTTGSSRRARRSRSSSPT